MQSSLYVALSAQVALQDRLDTLAQNVANGNTAGYRGNEVKFDSVISNLSREPVAFVASSTPIVRLTGGALVKTGNALDVAVKGDGWLSVESPQGPVYTRDGRMQMNAAGSLISVNGAPVLDSGGTPIQLDATAAASRKSPRMGASARAAREPGPLACSTSQATPSLPADREVSHPVLRQPTWSTSVRTASCKALWSSRTWIRSWRLPGWCMSSAHSKALVPRCNPRRRVSRMRYKR